MRLPQRGLYVILNAAAYRPEQAARSVIQAIAGGAVMVQFRYKNPPAARESGNHKNHALETATAVLAATQAAGVPLLINDDVALAQQIGAQGVHLGRSDADIAQARELLGPHALIGATCHASVDYAAECQAAGADHVSFGRFFASQTKPDAPAATIDVLTQARQRLACPIVAIGGINADNGDRLVAAGADILAVSAAVFTATTDALADKLSDISATEHAARAFTKIF